MTWQLNLLAVTTILVFAAMGALMVSRSVMQRRVKRATRELPQARFAGPAVLVGTSVDDDLSGVGALGLTETELVFVTGKGLQTLSIPLRGARARGYRQSEKQRAPSLRLDWDGQAAVFDVHKPGLDDWLELLPTVGR